MKIGILSDTHGQFEITKTAVKLLTDVGAEYFIHCGDVGALEIFDLLTGVPAAFVFGNCDFEQDAFKRYALRLGLQCLGNGGILTLSNKRIAVTHGDDPCVMLRLIQSSDPVNYLLTGHTHVRHDKRHGSVRWVNPGALYRSKLKSVALLDIAQDDLQFFSCPVN